MAKGADQKKKTLLDASAVAKTLDRMAAEIKEAYPIEKLALLGIQTRGVVLAKRLLERLDNKPEFGTLDITLYRDDLQTIAAQPVVKGSDVSFDVEGKVVLLIDDVLYTGRTIRAALNALMDFGRPEAVRLAVLVDRGLRELPIRADHVGRNVETTHDESVTVHVKEIDGDDEVTLEGRG